MKHILVTTDFSKEAAESFSVSRRVTELVGKENVKITLLNIIDAPLGVYMGDFAMGAAESEQFIRKVEEEAKVQVQHVAENEFQGLSVTATVARATSSIHQEIIDYATKNDVELIVVASHGRRGFQHFIMGSVAERIVRLSVCPVLVVPVPKS